MSHVLLHFADRVRYVESIRPMLLSLAKNYGTPLYVYDKSEALTNFHRFKNAFLHENFDLQVLYAVKSNPYPGLLRTIVEAGGSLDVSSERELELALAAGAQRIVYTGPAKTELLLRQLFNQREKVFVHLDSATELERLREIVKDQSETYECGIRVFCSGQSKWSRFGISLEELPAFLQRANEVPNLHMSALQFHISFNRNSENYVSAIAEIGRYLRDRLPPNFARGLKAIDIGGGFSPEAFEAIYSWNPSMDIRLSYPDGLLDDILGDRLERRFLPLSVTPIETIARDIAEALRVHIHPLAPQVKIWSEPGRFISHSSVHILLGVADMKPEKRFVITDGGTNMIGYERYQWQDYAPIFNLNSFSSTQEVPYLVYGSLCTAHDLWGYYLHTGGEIKIGDILAMPFQGAYTNTLAQRFIREIPPFVDLSTEHSG
jgi:diaminopimelate decarboxylase